MRWVGLKPTFLPVGLAGYLERLTTLIAPSLLLAWPGLIFPAQIKPVLRPHTGIIHLSKNISRSCRTTRPRNSGFPSTKGRAICNEGFR